MKKIFVIGVFANVVKDKYKLENTYIIPGEPEAFSQNYN